MKIAICTLVVGERFEKLFEKFCLRSWEHYCRSHNYELFVFRKPFAVLAGKSFAWQKLLLLEQPELAGFDKIIWLDADIIITRNAPPLEVPAGKLGYVLETPFTGSIESWYALFSLAPDPRDRANWCARFGSGASADPATGPRLSRNRDVRNARSLLVHQPGGRGISSRPRVSMHCSAL